MMLSIIVAISTNNAIGKENKLLWHLPSDLKMFKTITSGHCIIMGRNTYESIGKPLPNRTNIIISRQKELKIEGCLVAESIKMAIELAKNQNEIEAFIIGGGQIYGLALNLCQKIYLTRVHTNVDADVFFPVLDQSHWKLTYKESYFKNEKHAFDFDFEIWERKYL